MARRGGGGEEGREGGRGREEARGRGRAARTSASLYRGASSPFEGCHLGRAIKHRVSAVAGKFKRREAQGALREEKYESSSSRAALLPPLLLLLLSRPPAPFLSGQKGEKYRRSIRRRILRAPFRLRCTKRSARARGGLRHSRNALRLICY